VKVAIDLGPPDASWDRRLHYALEAERLGVEMVWTAEGWGYDAATPLAYLAAKTERIRLGTGIMQIGARTPAMTAMTALTLSALSHDRFVLGLGVSGPQVMEGWHGVPFAHPLERTREFLEMVRIVTRGERLIYSGEIYQVPLPGGEGKALVPEATPRPGLPVYLASLGPKNLELTGALADGWLGTSFIPEQARVYFDPLERGARSVGRTLAALDLQVNAGVAAFSDDVERLIPPRKPGLAFTLGAMGSRRHNFYNAVYRRAGYTELAEQVQALWLDRQREAAAALIPDELVLKTNLIGTPEMVLERLRTHYRAGVTTLRVATEGDSLPDRLATLSQLLDLVEKVNAEEIVQTANNETGSIHDDRSRS
jgi:F420-dependent oxidoreductase-like protein